MCIVSGMELRSAGMTASQAPANFFEEPVQVYSKAGSPVFDGFVQRYSGVEGTDGCSFGEPLRLRRRDDKMFWVPKVLEVFIKKSSEQQHIYHES